MSQRGVEIAKAHGAQLPTFGSLAAAETALFADRDAVLDQLLRSVPSELCLDYSPNSLKSLEHWLLTTWASSPNTAAPTSYAIGFYFGQVLCQNAGFMWVVQENTFAAGHYEIGVQRALATLMLTNGKHISTVGNNRMQSLWREYQKYAP